MKTHEYFRLIFAAGSLPFWTGLKKFKRFLLGNIGSFWEGETPLKPIYLSHYFFASFSRTDQSRLTQLIQNLIQSNYFFHGQLAENKPFRVLKLTGKGVRQYYNQLVKKRKIAPPHWRLNHVAQLNSPPGSRIATAGEVINFSGEIYLTQTPSFPEPQARVKEEKTLKLINPRDNIEADKIIQITNLQVDTDQGVKLKPDEKSEIETISGADLRSLLTHFSAPDTTPEEENPFILKGKLAGLKVEGSSLKALFKKGNKQVILNCDPKRQEELENSENDYFYFGPLKAKIIEFNEDKIPILELKKSGTIEPASPFA